MGDKSPKSKKRDQQQKAAAKVRKTADAKAKQFRQPTDPKQGKTGG